MEEEAQGPQPAAFRGREAFPLSPAGTEGGKGTAGSPLQQWDRAKGAPGQAAGPLQSAALETGSGRSCSPKTEDLIQ